jgi:hypothetical protein
MKHHFYLIAGKIVFLDHNGEEQNLGTTELNALLKLEKPLLTQDALNEATQRLQAGFFNQVQQAGADLQKINVVSVILLTTNYLGEMLDEEFYTVQPANDTEASADNTSADPALELARMGRDDATLQ